MVMIKHKIYLIVITILLVLTGIATNDRLTWTLEVFPVFIGIILMLYSYNKFKLTELLYFLLFIHFVILIYGGMYTYANTPLGNYVRDTLSLSRNPYDRLGHFAQGFIPAIVIRELFIRIAEFKTGKLFNTAIILSCMGISAGYEIIEWLSAVILGDGANEFLGMQGDVWDTQWDMFLATVGSSLSLIFLSKLHNKHISQLPVNINKVS
jgi:putative membrane protein